MSSAPHSAARFAFRVPTGTVTGAVQGNGGIVSSLARLLAAKKLAGAGRAHGLYEPAPGCVQVFPDYSVAGNGEAVVVALAALVVDEESAPTLSEALLARGYEHRAASHGAHDIVRISDGVVVTTLKASAAWEWVHAFDRAVAKAAKPKRHRHDFRDGDVCSTCDAARGAA
jgi:hypothetical protein